MFRTRSIAIPLALAVPLALALASRPSTAGDPEPVKKKTEAPAGKEDAKADTKKDAKEGETPAATAEPKLPEVTDAEALEIDITLVISLPLAADAARENGVDPAEVSDAITAVTDVGGSPADATEVLLAESERAKKSGGLPNFGAWVRWQVSEGKRGKELADAIKKKKAEYKALSDEDKAKVDERIAKLKGLWADRRAQIAERRAGLIEKGKKPKIAGEPTLKDLRKKLAKNTKRKDRLEKLFSEDPAKKEAFDKLIAKAEKALDKAEDVIDKAEDKLDKAEDKADKAEDKKDKAEDKKDKAEDKKDKAEDKKDKAEDKKEKKADDKKADEKKAG